MNSYPVQCRELAELFLRQEPNLLPQAFATHADRLAMDLQMAAEAYLSFSVVAHCIECAGPLSQADLNTQRETCASCALEHATT